MAFIVRSWSSKIQHHSCILDHFRMASNLGGPIESKIREKLTNKFVPIHFEVVNESYMHNVPKGSETHFKVMIVSDVFKDLALIKRHRLVNETLTEELESGVHALSIVAKTPEQWENVDNKTIEPSPSCRGGFGK
ncbi:bolA-like protein DDB_G0274169 [Tigriopus californicus]|uniref:bolA-like protein DDB_G0274169 n=1 Tax=Tigriopus californicus TaxID=6832 RepID=UPI0027D9EA2F|nr:bolA-like protein DDB_G0274169 [Tigriopus californicus]